ncbi:hypothetical protein TNCV_3361231 [Trichonephila clavipes]|nr:hypothetical protein TNCV_3361231 [Trichonephila clavipes]
MNIAHSIISPSMPFFLYVVHLGVKVTKQDWSSYEQLSEFERGRIIKMKQAGSANQRIARHIGRRIRPLEDTGKDGWTMANFSPMMAAIDLGPRQI